jgi:hypothetical protein
MQHAVNRQTETQAELHAGPHLRNVLSMLMPPLGAQTTLPAAGNGRLQSQ